MASGKREFACAINLNTLINSDCYFDVLGNLVLILDSDGVIKLFNSGGEEMLGYKSEELIGKKWVDICIPEKIRPQIKNVFKDMMDGKTDFLGEYTNEVINKKGEKVILQWHSSPLRDQKNIIEGVVSTAVDVTRLYNIENDLEEKIAQMEKMNKLMIGRELKMIELKERLSSYEK